MKISNYTKFCKVLTVLLISVMLFSLCSCGITDSLSNLKNDQSQQESSSSIDEQETESTTDSSATESAEEEPVDLINLDGLDALENKDTSNVKITKKEIQRDAVSGFTMQGGDALYFTVENKENTDVTALTIYVVGYTEKNGLASVQPSLSVSFGTVPYIQSFESTDTTIKAGESEKIGIEVDADKFSNVKAIVASYTTSDGKTHENSIAEDWVNSVQLGKNTVLD